MADKWDKYADKPDKWSQYATEDAPEAPDFTKGAGGLFQMVGPDRKTKDIPYSRVMDAAGAGWKMDNRMRERYARDRKAEILKTQPKISEQDYIKAMQLPEAVPEQPGPWSRLRQGFYKATEPTSYMPGMPTASPFDPATGEMTLNALKRAGRVVFGLADFGPQGYSALSDAMSADPQKAADGEARLLAMHPGAQVADRLKELRDDWRRDPKIALANVGGDIFGLWLTQKATEAPFKTAGKVATALTERYGPRPVKVAGVNIPMTVGEANPLTRAGRLETRLKQSGIGAERFERLEHGQQVLVKRAIRNVAGMASETDAHGLPADPQAAMKDAAEIVFDRARPMYAAMDTALRTTPASFGEVSPIVKTAIERARRLGVVIEPEAAEVIMDGKKITRAEHPELWRRLVDQGIINEQGQGTPLSAFVKVRSQLLKIQRASADPAVRYAAGEEVRNMNTAIETALKNTPHFDNWETANKLWSKAYALRDVAEAIRKSTKGTPSRAQAPELSRVAPKLQASGLVSRLNQLAQSGILDKAFTPEEAQHLRAAADVLDRIQRTKVGKGPGEHMSFSRGLSHAMRGAAAPAIGAGAGLIVGGIHGAELGAGLGLAVKWIGERALVRVMTQADGVAAIKALEIAKTPAETQAALRALTTAAAATGAGQKRSLKELNSEAKKRRPVDSTAPIPAPAY